MAFPHLVNAGKYSTTFFNVLFSTLYKVETGKYKDNTITVSKIDYYNKIDNQLLKHKIVFYSLNLFIKFFSTMTNFKLKIVVKFKTVLN